MIISWIPIVMHQERNNLHKDRQMVASSIRYGGTNLHNQCIGCVEQGAVVIHCPKDRTKKEGERDNDHRNPISNPIKKSSVVHTIQNDSSVVMLYAETSLEANG